jgi:CRISPR-associated protein Csc1
MTTLYRGTIELHDSLYFATREIGRLYETEAVLHNYALCYAMGLVDSDRYATTVPEEHHYRYFCAEQVPKYSEHLTPLNARGIYVTPARSIHHATTLNTWKYADNRYHVEMTKTQKNIPSFGRTKEIAAESIFECFLIATQELELPKKQWIRLGKWMSKAEVQWEELPGLRQGKGSFTCTHPLNPLDVMISHRVISYDVINMPPVSLIQNVHLEGQYYEAGSLRLPAMSYRFQ